ncbi:MAG: hypothetical protein ABW184_01200 [Sphingobium sp.]
MTSSCRRPRDERAQDVPFSIVALSAETLKRKSIAQLSQLQFAVPNLQIGNFSTTCGCQACPSRCADCDLPR